MLDLNRLGSGWRADVLALLAGALLPLAYAPVGVWPLAPLAVAVLFLLWLFASPRQALRRGLLFGMGQFGVGISWIFISIYYHGHVPLLLSLFLTALLVLVLALFPAVLGYLVVRGWPQRHARRYAGIKLLLVLPAAWALWEWVRGWLFTGFPWLSLGYSQTDTWLAGWAPLLGVFGVSWLVALCAALLVALLLDGKGRKWYLLALAAVWLAGLALQWLPWTQPSGKPMRVALLQGNIPQDIKWLPEVRESTIELYTALGRNYLGVVDLIVWPETALPGMYSEEGETLMALETEARARGTDMLLGLIYDAPDGRYYNSMVSLGSANGVYHKHHLVPFTEYLPLKTMLGGVVDFMRVPMSDFSAGDARQMPLAVAGQRAGISICFEDAFGEEAVRALPQATLLVNVSNDGWFDNSWAPHQHLQMARMRAIETGRPMLRATNTGVSAIIDHRGRLLKVAPQFAVYALEGEIQPMQGMTPYAWLANWPLVILLLAGLVLGWRLCDSNPAP